jgi:beta-mannosidase
VVDWLDGWMDTTWAYRFGPRAFDLAVLRWRDAQGGLLAQAMHVDPKDMPVFQGHPGLQGRAVRLDDGRVQVDFSTRAAAYGVHFDVTGWRVSDEFFHLPPGGQHTVFFTPCRPQAHWHAAVCAVNARQWTSLLLTHA